MKLAQDLSPVEISGAIGDPQQFKISASKEAFKILSSGLYNNKILAIVRELACNSYDSHVAAGKKEVPFEIHLPTRIEPFFSVRDDGIGLSHEHVLSLYTTYFGTNKSQSNDFVGALGLGSKSPFCYTEGFSVTSRYQGMTRVYSCYISDQGTPTVLLQTEDKTPGESNGLEVQFPVKVSDIWEYENQTKKALEFFDPPPILNTKIDIPKKEYVIKTPLWGLKKVKDYVTEGVRAIQGMVPYDVGTIDQSRLSNKQHELLQLPLDIFFPIGELAVTASREKLSNDDRTINNILKGLDQIYGTLVEEIKKQLSVCKTQWEARLMVFNLINTPGFGGLVNSAFNKGLLDGNYENFTLTNKQLEIKEADYPDISVVYFTRSYNTAASKTHLSSSPGKEKEIIRIDPSPESIFILNDVGFGMEKYIHYFLQSAPDNQGTDRKRKVYFINRLTKDTLNSAVLTQGKKIIKELGNPDMILLSTLKERYAEDLASEKTQKEYVPRKYIQFNLGAYLSRYRTGYEVKGWRDAWKEAKTPDPAIPLYYYIKVKNLVPLDGKFEWAEDLQSFLQGVIASGMFGMSEGTIIYGLTEIAPQLKHPRWINLIEHVFKTLTGFMTPAKELELSLHLKRFNIDRYLSDTLSVIAKDKPLNPNSPMQKFCDSLAGARKYNKNTIEGLSVVLAKAEKLGIYTVKNLIDFNKIWEGVKEQYPLIDYIKLPYTSDQGKLNKHLIEYFKLKDIEIENERQKLLLVQNIPNTNEEEGESEINVSVN